MELSAKTRGKASRRHGPPGRRVGPGGAIGLRLLAPMVILLAGLITYANSFSGTFVLDDDKHVLDNPRILTLWPLSDTLGGRRPVVDLSLAINYALGGLETWGYHAFNLAVHLLAGLTLFGVVRRTLESRPVDTVFKRRSTQLALVVAVLWLVHPLQTQSVTYIIQRAEALMGLFYLLTLYCVIRGLESDRQTRPFDRQSVRPFSRRNVWYLAAMLCCAAGMGSKAVMVTAPVAVLLYDRVFASGSFGESLRRRWGLYVGLCSTWLILFLCGVVSGVFRGSARGATVGFGYQSISPLEYLVTQFGVIVHYLRLAVWPRPLCLDYGWEVAEHVWLSASLGVIIVSALCLALWAIVRGWTNGYVGLVFFLVLAPTSSFVPIKDPAFEHRMYLPLAPVIVLAVIGAYAVLTSRLGAWTAEAINWRRIVPGIAMIAALFLAYVTVQRNRDYHSALGMWQDVIAKRPEHSRAYLGLGTALFGRAKSAAARGAQAVARQGFLDAEQSFAQAVALKPTNADALYNLGNAKVENGKVEEAIEAFRQSLSINPRNAKCHYNLGNALKRTKRYAEAMAQYREAIRIEPKHISAYINLGNTLKLLGRLNEAIAQYHRALAIKPRYANAHFNLGEALWLQDKREQALNEFRLTLEYDPNHANARKWLQRASNQLQGEDED